MKSEKKFVLWLTGLSGAGKTTLAQRLCQQLNGKETRVVHHLDGDEVRAASREKLGFSKEDRDKNIHLAIGLAKQYQEQGLHVIASFISPYKEHRQWGREWLTNYIEVFVHAPLEVCEERDTKGMYKKARQGAIAHFTGIDDPYEEPESPDIHLRTDILTVDECVKEILQYLEEREYEVRSDE